MNADTVEVDSPSGLEDAAEERLASTKCLLETRKSLSYLENLPAELRSEIISHMPDLPTLKSLIHASPILHAQYIHSRDSLLHGCLQRELDGFRVDAYANLMSRVCKLKSPRTDKTITDFLDTYHGWLSGSIPPPNVASGCIRWMAAYHLRVARPLARLYSKWALANLRKGASSLAAQRGVADEVLAQSDHKIGLTRSEKIRIFRALYRYDTYYHLFGRNKGKRRGGFRHHEINQHFFCLLNPWEAEAIGCIDLFVRESYEDIFNKVKEDLQDFSPRFKLEDGTYHHDGTFDLTSEHDDYMDGTISRGLKMKVRLLAIDDLDDHEKLVSEMQRCLTHDQCIDHSVCHVLGIDAQAERREEMSTNFPNARDAAEERNDPMDFIGDAMPPDGPPLAWVLLWDGKYANIYGEYVPESLRRWGYVMWNESRWADMGAKELVVKQWETAPELIRAIECDLDWSPVGRRSTTAPPSGI